MARLISKLKNLIYVNVKKIFSIFLLFIFLFNVVGYYGIYLTMLNQAQLVMNKKIDDNQFTDDQTITVKVPLTLPYTLSDNTYERLNGDFEWRGEFFKLVKQKYQNDTLFIVCLKNTEKKKAFNVFTDLVKLSTDQNSSSAGQHLKSVISFIKDFSPVTNSFELNLHYSVDKKYFPLLTVQVLHNDFPVFGPPPETIL